MRKNIDCDAGFQSAPPVKGATSVTNGFPLWTGVSIRAPREGGDLPKKYAMTSIVGFNPRPP